MSTDESTAENMSPSELAAMGGRARAQSLSKEDRSEIARQAAAARWNIPRATHAGEVRIGDELSIPCAVLESGERVLSETGVVTALGLYRSGALHTRQRDSGRAQMPLFVAHKNLIPYVSEELADVLANPIWYLPPNQGTKHKGLDARLIPKVCEVWLKARDAGVLKTPTQIAAAAKADILIRGLAELGIVALVDEATGYQEVRDREALQEILSRYLRRELAAWAKRFPDEFYKEIFRLRAWEWRGMKVNRPQCVAKYTRDLVYERLAPGIVDELETRNPKVEGRRKQKHHQWLTDDVGHPALAQHLHAVIGLMRASDTWDQFKRLINRSFPKQDMGTVRRLFDLNDDEE